MILNVWTVTAVFLAALGVLLASGAMVIALRGLVGLREDGERPAHEDRQTDRAHLLALVLAVLLGLRLLAWPHFYSLLASYVPALSGYGLMCAFGVTRIQPGLVDFLEWAKPALVLGLGFWMLLEAVSRRTERPTLLRARFGQALALALLALAECGVELAYILRDKAGRPVTCCTQFLETAGADLPDVSAPLTDSWSAGLHGPALYVLVGALTIVLSLYLRRAGLAGWKRVAMIGVLAGLGVLGLLVTLGFWTETLAPRVLGLPYHRCVYELLTATPALALAAALAVLGNGALAWPLGLSLVRRASPSAVLDVERAVYGFCALALASSMTVVAVHLVF